MCFYVYGLSTATVLYLIIPLSTIILVHPAY